MNTRFEIPLAEPCLDGQEAAYVADAIARNEIAIGEYIPRFEAMVAAYVGVCHAVAVSSGTAALHLALLVVAVEPGDEVILPALTFIATANAVSYCGAIPVFVDAEPEYWQMDMRAIANCLPYINIPVHSLGHPADMCNLDPHGRSWMIEDATEALGAEYRGQMVGTVGNVAALSFNGNKTVTTGGGGMVLTDNSLVAMRIRYLANQAKDDPVEYRHNAIGYNYRMSNLAAAVGCAQMERIADKLAAKRRIAETYGRELAGMPGLTLPREAPWARSSWWAYVLLVDEEKYGMTARELRTRLTEVGIESRTLWQPLHLSPAYQDCYRGALPVAERLWQTALSLPCSVGMSEQQQERVIEEVRRARKS